MRLVTPLVISVLASSTLLAGLPNAQAADLQCLGHPATIVGTEGPDILNGTPAADVIVALGGKDRVTAGDGDDIVCGGPNPATFHAKFPGGIWGEVLEGGAGNDTISGGAGDDLLYGGPGDDLLLVDESEPLQGDGLYLPVGTTSPATEYADGGLG